MIDFKELFQVNRVNQKTSTLEHVTNLHRCSCSFQFQWFPTMTNLMTFRRFHPWNSLMVSSFMISIWFPVASLRNPFTSFQTEQQRSKENIPKQTLESRWCVFLHLIMGQLETLPFLKWDSSSLFDFTWCDGKKAAVVRTNAKKELLKLIFYSSSFEVSSPEAL